MTMSPADRPPEPQAPEERQAEELRMLLMGFGTGLTIAAVFLVYIVFEYAKWLP
jgi:hypothetical protein